MDISSNAVATKPDVARANRELLRRSGVFTVNLIGGAGCGKTSLLDRTLQRLLLSRRVGVVVAEPHSRFDTDRLRRVGDQVTSVDGGAAGALTPGQFQGALRRLDLDRLDVLLVENVGCLLAPGEIDLGEDAKVTVFSVAAGHDKPAQYANVTRCARVIILNKIDLFAITPFDREVFRTTVTRLNPTAEVFELSTLTGDGLEAWVEWLLRCSPRGETNAPSA